MKKTAPDRSDLIRRHLRRMALEIHPDAKFTTLALDINVTTATLTNWINRGRIPRKTARFLERKFGPTLAPVDVLTGVAS